MKLEFELSLARSQGGDESKPMHLSINDILSGSRVLDASFSLEGFSELLTNRYIIAIGELYGGPIGCKREHKTEQVPKPEGYRHDEALAAIALAPFEIDGWKGDKDDLWNGHRRAGDGTQSVSFVRYIRPDGTIWEPAL